MKHVLCKDLGKGRIFGGCLHEIFNAYFYLSLGNNIFRKEEERYFSSHPYFRMLYVHFKTPLSLKFGE